MKKIFLLFWVLFCGVQVFAQADADLPAPGNPPRLVTDFTGHFLTPEQMQALEAKLVKYDDTTSNQIAIIVVPELKGYSIGDYATAIGRKWGVGGQKQFSNGIVVLVNTGEKGDKRGVFIATGYGLEGAVPDVVASSIVQKDLIPNLKEGNNYRALDMATDDLMQAAAGRYTAPDDYHEDKEGNITLLKLFIIVIIIYCILRWIGRKGGGGGNGGYVSRRGYRDNWGGGGLPWIIPGGWSNRGGGGGGGWSGGGGFGGFGGGSFGGGGAGGDW